MENDLKFISGTFFDCVIPKEQHYLLRYFRNDFQKSFLRYILTFGNYRLFRQHTGHYCSKRMLKYLSKRYRILKEAHADAKKNLTEDGMRKLSQIESGKYPVDNTGR